MYDRIAMSFAAGAGVPDLAVIHAERIRDFVRQDMIMPLDDLLSDFPRLSAPYYLPQAWDIGAVDGVRYAIPLDVHTWVMFYNLDLLEYYGVAHVLDDRIVTIDEIHYVGGVLAARGSERATVGMTWPWVNWSGLYTSLGGRITADGINPTIYNDLAVQAFEIMRGFVTAGISNPHGVSASTMWQTEELIFIPEGIWYLNIANTVEDFRWGVTHNYQIDANNPINWTSSHQFVMFRSDERSEDMARGILHYLEWTQENSLHWARAGQNPAALAILESPEFQEMPQSFLLTTDVGQQSMFLMEYLFNGFVSAEVNRVGDDIQFSDLDIREELRVAQQIVEDQIAHALGN